METGEEWGAEGIRRDEDADLGVPAVGEIMHGDLTALAVHKPNLSCAGTGVFQAFDSHVEFAGGGAEDFDHKVRCALDALFMDYVPPGVADKHEIRLENVVPVQLDIHRRDEHGAKLVLVYVIGEEERETDNRRLMIETGTGSHV